MLNYSAILNLQEEKKSIKVIVLPKVNKQRRKINK
jgi:hypothetical protein